MQSRNHNHSHHTLTALGLAALTATIVAGCGAHPGARGAAGGGLLRVGFITNSGNKPTGPEGWEYQDGHLLAALRPAGVTQVQFTGFPNGPDLDEAMAAGALDVGLVGDTPAIIGRAAGLPVHAINQEAVGNNAWLIVRPDGPKTLNDLRGKTVATSKGSYMARYLIGLLQENNLTTQVKFVHLLPPEAESALRRGDIAAYAAPTGTGPLLLSHGFRAIDQAVQHPGLTGSGITIVANTYLQAHPDFPRLWNNARDAGIQDIQAHQAQYYQFVASTEKLPLPIVVASFPLSNYPLKPFTPQGLAQLDATKAFLVSQHLAKSDFPLQAWVYPPPSTGIASAVGNHSVP